MTEEFLIAGALESAVFMTAVFLWFGGDVLYKVCQDRRPTVRLSAGITSIIWAGAIVVLVYSVTIK